MDGLPSIEQVANWPKAGISIEFERDIEDVRSIDSSWEFPKPLPQKAVWEGPDNAVLLIRQTYPYSLPTNISDGFGIQLLFEDVELVVLVGKFMMPIRHNVFIKTKGVREVSLAA